MSRDEALVAVLNAARALRGTDNRDMFTRALGQLYAAVDAVDAVGESTDWTPEQPPYRCVCPGCTQSTYNPARLCVSCGTLGTHRWCQRAGTDDARAAPECPAAVPLSINSTQQKTPNAKQGHERPAETARLCTESDCWRYADLPSGTCHMHSEYARKPHPWECAALRSGVFAVSDEVEKLAE